MAEWYYAKDGNKCGPVSPVELRELAVGGKLLPEDKVWKEGLEGWIEASLVDGLFDGSKSPPPLDQVYSPASGSDSPHAKPVSIPLEPVPMTRALTRILRNQCGSETRKDLLWALSGFAYFFLVLGLFYCFSQSGEEQFALGNNYRSGEGVVQDDVQAAYWYRKAAMRGHTKSQLELAFLYARGHGISSDNSAAAAHWYQIAAEQGRPREYSSGFMAGFLDFGKPSDSGRAVQWLQKSAEQGYANAQFMLGHMYDTGYGVGKNDVQAITWYRKAAEQGEVRAIHELNNRGPRWD